uniref:FPL domain-containing protein n=1 Tax=Heterorhabditis bacteriophora TaxID=37862 RepID=A0A1I7XR50_HETBA
MVRIAVRNIVLNIVRVDDPGMAEFVKTATKVDDLVDLLHYIGELLDVNVLAESLSSLVSSRFLIPLLLNSLAPRRHNSAVLLTPVSSLFFFAEFLLVVAHRETIQTFLSSFLFEDASILTSHWVRTNESFCLQSTIPSDRALDSRVFFNALLGAFDATKNDDYLSFYGLMLIYAMFQNKGGQNYALAIFDIIFVHFISYIIIKLCDCYMLQLIFFKIFV